MFRTFQQKNTLFNTYRTCFFFHSLKWQKDRGKKHRHNPKLPVILCMSDSQWYPKKLSMRKNE